MNAKVLKSNLSKCCEPVRCFRKLTVKYENRNNKRINGYVMSLPIGVVQAWNLHDLLVECIYDAQTDLMVVGPVSKIEKFLAEE